jgi:hypothetical protein
MEARLADTTRVATFDRYRDAYEAVEVLATVDDGTVLRIVGADLRYASQRRERRSYRSAVLLASASGALAGIATALVFAALGWVADTESLVDAAAAGALVGVLLGLVTAVSTTARRDAGTVGHLEPARFEVVAGSPDQARHARHVLLNVREGARSRSV